RVEQRAPAVELDEKDLRFLTHEVLVGQRHQIEVEAPLVASTSGEESPPFQIAEAVVVSQGERGSVRGDLLKRIEQQDSPILELRREDGVAWISERMEPCRETRQVLGQVVQASSTRRSVPRRILVDGVVDRLGAPDVLLRAAGPRLASSRRVRLLPGDAILSND